MIARITWPKLLGTAVGSMGLLVTVSRAAVWASRAYTGDSRLDWMEVLIAAFGALLLFLSVPLFGSRLWALRVLLGVSAFLSLASAVLAAWFITHPPAFSDGPPPEDFRRAMELQRVADVTNILWLMIPPLFFALVLLHRDVVSSFAVKTSDDGRNI